MLTSTTPGLYVEINATRLGRAKGKTFTEYGVDVCTVDRQRAAQTWHRFSEFDDLRKKIQKQSQGGSGALPKLPKKKAVSKADAVVQDRMLQLRIYVERLLVTCPSAARGPWSRCCAWTRTRPGARPWATRPCWPRTTTRATSTRWCTAWTAATARPRPCSRSTRAPRRRPGGGGCGSQAPAEAAGAGRQAGPRAGRGGRDFGVGRSRRGAGDRVHPGRVPGATRGRGGAERRE